jgi:hypothetical protein
LSGSIRPERCKEATLANIVPVGTRQILADYCGEWIIAAAFDYVRQPFGTVSQHTVAGLNRQVVFRAELFVEPSLRKACRAHQVIQAYSVETMFAEQPAGRLDNDAPILFRLCTTDSHETSH